MVDTDTENAEMPKRRCATARPEAIEPEAVDEYLHTFAGPTGVLGSEPRSMACGV